MNDQARILIVDDDADFRTPLADRLEAWGFAVAQARNGAEGLERIRRDGPDVVLLDLQMPVMDGMEVLQQVKAEGLDPIIVVITGYSSVERVVLAVKAGAHDFIPKPYDNDHVRAVVTNAVERARLRTDNALLREQAEGAPAALIESSTAMQDAHRMARRAADSPATVLLLGESGTGKEVLARLIHQWSPRHDRPFVAVNCVALSENLLESELFGHEKGAFTGADRKRVGRFEAARGGTLFLDEIGPTSTQFQLRLLRVLQERTFERVGGDQTLTTDVRVIAATNRDLEEAMRDGRFLHDLYYRLNVVAIRLPPLRERRADIRGLAEHFLRKHGHEAKRRVTGLADTAIERLEAYDWPGNVRELENAVERAVVLGADELIWPDDLPDQILEATVAAEPSADGSYEAAVKAYKRRVIQEALANNSGNQSRAAAQLSLQRSYLSRLMRNLGLR